MMHGSYGQREFGDFFNKKPCTVCGKVKLWWDACPNAGKKNHGGHRSSDWPTFLAYALTVR